MKNTLIVYEGGGYDGCIYENNYAIFDQNSKFIDLFSSGVFGCDTEKKIKKVLDDPFIYQTFKLPKEFKDFASHHNEGHVVEMTKRLNKLGYNVSFNCDICNCEVKEGIGGEPESAGGIAMANTIKLCEDCYVSHSCSYCGEFYKDSDDFDQEGYCEYCHEEREIEIEKRC